MEAQNFTEVYVPTRAAKREGSKLEQMGKAYLHAVESSKVMDPEVLDH